MARQVIQGETPLRCGVDSNHRVASLAPVRRGAFVLHCCAACAADEARLAREFAALAADLRAAMQERR